MKMQTPADLVVVQGFERRRGNPCSFRSRLVQSLGTDSSGCERVDVEHCEVCAESPEHSCIWLRRSPKL